MQISEIFGIDYEDRSTAATQARFRKACPFRDTPCTKASKSEPLGICTLSNGATATALCPVRFLEKDRIFVDAARIAFGDDVRFAVFPEIRILKIEKGGEKEKKIGKVDFLIGRIENETIVDFAAVEVQAVYFSGTSIRPSLEAYLSGEELSDEDITRRPDFRSSAQKRLIPQLMLKVPVFRRWGKKFFVVVDSVFFGELPKFPTVSQSNSEITWLSYPIRRSQTMGYAMADPLIVPSHWEDVATSLREGKPPEIDEITQELQDKLKRPGSGRPRVLVS